MKRIYILLASMMTICSAAAMEDIKENIASGVSAAGQAVNGAAQAISNKINPQPTLWQKIQKAFKPGADAFAQGFGFVTEFAKDVATHKAPEAYQTFMDLDPMKKIGVVAGVVITGYVLVKTMKYCFSGKKEIKE
jgi:hypothetical protein